MKGKTIMHPSQMSGFRKTIIAAITIMFAGALLVFTAQANIDLLTSVYPDPRFVMFGLLALEGGVVYWTGYYLLHASGVHKGLAVIALAIDALLSGIGFFYEMENVTNSVGTIKLPPVIIVVAAAVLFNVAMSIISHLIPSGSYVGPRPKDDGYYVKEHQPARLEQRSTASHEQASHEPGFIANTAANFIATGQDVLELAAQKRRARKEQRVEQVQVQEEIEPAHPAKHSLPPMRHYEDDQRPDPSQAPSE
jgi:hypothetical protein